MEQVEEICDHIILVNKGQKILDGTVGGVKQQYKENLFSIGLESPDGPETAGEAVDKHGETIGEQGEAVAAGEGWRPEGAAFETVGQKDGHWIIKIREGYRANDVLRQFIDRGIGITSFTEILPSLNDIFIRLVEGTPLTRQFSTIPD
jgi:ABC-2 type transport system ATP-binding protein